MKQSLTQEVAFPKVTHAFAVQSPPAVATEAVAVVALGILFAAAFSGKKKTSPISPLFTHHDNAGVDSFDHRV